MEQITLDLNLKAISALDCVPSQRQLMWMGSLSVTDIAYLTFLRRDILNGARHENTIEHARLVFMRAMVKQDKVTDRAT